MANASNTENGASPSVASPDWTEWAPPRVLDENGDGTATGAFGPSSAQRSNDGGNYHPSSQEVFPYKRTVTREDHYCNYQRKDSIATKSTASGSNDSSQPKRGSPPLLDSIVGNTVWNRLLASESVWDSLNVTRNEDEDVLPQEIYYREKSRQSSAAVLCLTVWYEIRHFLKTTFAHPHILLTSLAVTGLVAGVGMWAITSEKDAHVNEKMATASFVAKETAAYFSNEFKRAFVPLYSLRAAVQHSGYFDDLASKIGRYPNLLKAGDVEVPGGLANVRDVGGICDDVSALQKWEDLLDASTIENDLEGLIVRYRLMPKNVACLDYKGGKAAMDSGMDFSNSKHPFWKMVTEDLFVKRWKGLHTFGPFLAGGQEMFCTHLAIWNEDPNGRNRFQDGSLSLENIKDDFIDVHGTEVEAWGIVMNYLNWGELKERSNMHERFTNVGMDFHLNRREEDIDPDLPGPRGEPTRQYAYLASSENSHLLDDSNSIVIETESLHGIWENRVGITDANGWTPEWYWPAVASLTIISILLGLLTASTLVKSQLHRDLVKSMLPEKAIKKLQRSQTVIEKFNLITVFYADIVDFSGGSMSSVQVMNMLNDLFCELDKITVRHGVYKVATTGNRYMVVGGAINPESARVAATRVALFALDAMACLDNICSTKSGERLYLRAGIASNPAVAGVVGKTAPRYCFFGDAVDIASAMEKTSEKAKIQCSEVTFRLLQDSDMKFILTKRVDEDANGEVVPRDTYWVENASPCEKCFELTQGSYVLDPCGHILCAGCNGKYSLNVCPICRRKVDDRSKWTGKSRIDVEDDESNDGSCIFHSPAI
mmetsp:Transcript_19823/g.42534  ORF Transcript_19823/g.42534 Transcript_19823/m.42534 type:complete len:826 (+) Transcript_19823:97-2574(+)|eukprot:CAMPEP_0172528888 /NCGR_PEP_ID=MMETSP1067-20121228/3111_1 /TAXON_ID=265564 ORGANISM="Thalassiosira punctigera, Strain Tpunct2005C2" /NCGR_SAMPLE_ID=MMETSP1067 /ASSEMBLY_ACC=CAM_ASM_000444 /LENGTH=825 /DNA_ID=CAMNT_0013312863 /DNA_START=95 /DNA_END=2572 /DNA_ORIENTATION=+